MTFVSVMKRRIACFLPPLVFIWLVLYFATKHVAVKDLILGGSTYRTVVNYDNIIAGNDENFTRYILNLRSDILFYRSIDPYFIPRKTVVNDYKYSFLIDAGTLCSKEKPFLLIVVPIAADHVESRMIIRRTWGRVGRTGKWADGTKLPSIKLLFFMGIKPGVDVPEILRNESAKFGDIALSNFTDSYKNLTIKTMSVLKWTMTYCPDAQYLLKNDDDEFVHIPRLITFLQSSSSGSLIGAEGFQLQVVRKAKADSFNSKWTVSKSEYSPDFYPPYLLGNFYVIPGQLVPILFHTSEYLPLLTMEDVFITGMVRTALGIGIEDVGDQACLFECDLNNTRLIGLTVGIERIEYVWNHFSRKIPK